MSPKIPKTVEQKIILACWILAVVAATIAVTGWLFFRREIPPEIPLFYSRPWGQEQLTQPYWLAIPMGLAVIGGVFIPWVAKRRVKETVLTIMLLAATLAFQALLLLAVIRILSLIL